MRQAKVGLHKISRARAGRPIPFLYSYHKKTTRLDYKNKYEMLRTSTIVCKVQPLTWGVSVRGSNLKEEIVLSKISFRSKIGDEPPVRT